MGEGVSFKAKLIGILEVSEARGDRMCQEALSDLKMAIRAAGEHKQRITITIAIDGLRLRDEKTGVSLDVQSLDVQDNANWIYCFDCVNDTIVNNKDTLINILLFSGFSLPPSSS